VQAGTGGHYGTAVNIEMLPASADVRLKAQLPEVDK
jgi:hypothetical protein